MRNAGLSVENLSEQSPLPLWENALRPILSAYPSVSVRECHCAVQSEGTSGRCDTLFLATFYERSAGVGYSFALFDEIQEDRAALDSIAALLRLDTSGDSVEVGYILCSGTVAV